jgi:Fic family protein
MWSMTRTVPPFDLTDRMLDIVFEIETALGRLPADFPPDRHILLRRANRIRTVHASCAVEGNTLTAEQVEAVLEGRKVRGPAKEISEVQNALASYDRLDEWNSAESEDLRAAHGVLMAGLVDRPGEFRHGAAGIAGAAGIVHVAPPADRVPHLVNDLLSWLDESDVHPLVKGCVVHYELEFIHPFVDGNGRLGRLWQTLIVGRWNPLCLLLPVEHVIRDRQPAYYAALRESDSMGRSTPFIRFMLDAIRESLDEFVSEGDMAATPQVTPQVKRLLAVCEGELSRSELQTRLGLADRKHFRTAYLLPALDVGLIEMTIPDKPRSSAQRYRLSPTGERMGSTDT